MSLSEAQVNTIVERIVARLDGGPASAVADVATRAAAAEPEPQPASQEAAAEAGRRVAREALAAGHGTVGVYGAADEAIAAAGRAARLGGEARMAAMPTDLSPG